MPLIKFSQFLSESGDLQLLHTAANISVPKIHNTEGGAHIAVHRTSTGEHADWLKGKFEKALKHNPSRAHIKVEVHHDNDEHSVHVTHTPPKKLKEDTFLESFKKYNTGDHVHLKSYTNSYGNSRVLKHGIVGKASDRTAEVHWEDGTKSKHLHTSGKAVGTDKDTFAHRISHNEVHHREEGKTPGIKRLSNSEHKAHIAQQHAAEDAAKAHRASHAEAVSKMQNLHHTQLKPHHLAAIHAILDKAKNGED